MSHRAIVLAAFLTGTFAAGCGPGARLDTPPGFATLDKQKEYVYRSTSAEGVVIAIRGEKNDPKGNLDFWADAIDRQLRNNRYKLDGKPSDVRSRSGQSGRQTRYTREDGGRSYRFWATVFVTDDKVWVVEAGGDQERFTGKLEQTIARAIETTSFN
jgi:hypothetical protein